MKLLGALITEPLDKTDWFFLALGVVAWICILIFYWRTNRWFQKKKGGLRFVVPKPRRVNWALRGKGFWKFRKFSSIVKRNK